MATLRRLRGRRAEAVRPSDYPMMFWLGQLFRDGCRKVFDVGGRVSVRYTSLARFVSFPPALHWLVCDVPTVARQGRRRAAERDGRRQLAFTEALEDAEGFDVLLAAGVLQYLPAPMSEALGTLSSKPSHLLVNSVALHPALSFYTVQSLHGGLCVPYRITQDREFVASYERIGYELVDRWEIPEEKCIIPNAPRHSIDRFHGFYFRRRALA
ncbi:MAG TPA: methyltransferase, TIGR04325 family [Kofleriaceae bacterium]|nr:methyltransferase, TIGR04325 family [Kofleriaceae bacterium]